MLKGSEGSIEPMMLTLGVAVEGILREAFKESMEKPSSDSEELKKAQILIEKSLLDNKLKSRLKSVIGSWTTRSATDALYLLAESNIIDREEVDAWKKIRHSMAHATFPDFDLQKLIDLCHSVVVLFYKLIFHTIGYNGKYTNYGRSGWPVDDFPKKIEDKTSADNTGVEK